MRVVSWSVALLIAVQKRLTKPPLKALTTKLLPYPNKPRQRTESMPNRGPFSTLIGSQIAPNLTKCWRDAALKSQSSHLASHPIERSLHTKTLR